MTAKRFTAEVYAGHTTDCGAIVPFDPGKSWKRSKLRPVGYRKHAGHAVYGTIDGEPFESWVFHYHLQWRLIVPADALAAAGVAAGDVAKFSLRPHPEPDEVPHFTPGPKRR